MALVPWTYNNPHTLDSKSPLRSLPLCGRNLRVLQDFSDEITVHQNTHRKLWDGAFLLAKYLETQFPESSSFWRKWRKRHNIVKAVELGAGCGLVGMTASLLGADEVRLTDDAEGIGHTKKCVEANREALNGDAASNGGSIVHDEGNTLKNGALSSINKKISCDVLDWCEGPSVWDKTFSLNSYHLVLGSDIIYSNDERILNGLLDAIDYLSNADSLILFSYKPRGLGEDVFFKMAESRGFNVEIIDRSLHPKEFFGSDYQIISLKKT